MQEHVFSSRPAPAADSPLRYAADTLAMMLGDDYRQPALLGPGRSRPGRVGRLRLPRLRGHRLVLHFVQLRARTQREANLAIVARFWPTCRKTASPTEELHRPRARSVARGPRQRTAHGPHAGDRHGVDLPGRSIAASTTSWHAFEAVDLGQIRQVLDKYPLTQPAIFARGRSRRWRTRSDMTSTVRALNCASKVEVALATTSRTIAGFSRLRPLSR